VSTSDGRAVFAFAAAVMVAGCSQLLGADFEGGRLREDDGGATTDDAAAPDAGTPDGESVPPHVVLFGGLVSGEDDVTWTWDGTSWTRRNVTPHPPGRFDHAMATLGRTVVLFGGSRWSDVTTFADTWVWDGTRWEEKHPAHSPEARSGHQMATVNGRVVLYGGTGRSASLKDPHVMWTWDGTDWTPGGIPNPPEVFTDAGSALHFCMAGSNDTLLLIRHSSESGWAETWVYRSGWTNLGAWQAAGDRVTALPDDAGFFMVGYQYPDEAAWAFLGNQAWTPVVRKPSPPARGGTALVTFRGKVMLWGGGDIGEASIFYNDTWLFDGSTWSVTPPSVFDPPLRYRHAMGVIP
jgi:hypothetical protein